ncbi:hypothetical protein [Aliivibrio fischeri]|uniref:hypothetical protein n=1 Tax=Aliivibrio fischeri TaxID=668 RepID=UPI0007C5BE68|nr:hypothetical protein [Aliivibrio fischeri]
MNNLVEKETEMVEVLDDNEKYQLVLPCDVKDFRTFISSLLGKPQEERGAIEGTFHAEIKDISNIYHLIDQRVTQQNDSSLVNFSLKVLYDNGTSIVHNKIEQFESYFPTSNTTPVEIILTLSYLIKFQTSKTPEKQEVEVVISLDDDRLRKYKAWFSGGVFEYSIKHTNRTWASDIANVLKNHSTNFMKKKTRFLKLLDKYGHEAFDYSFWIMIFIFSTFWFFDTKSIFFGVESKKITIEMISEHILNFIYLLIVLCSSLKLTEYIAINRFFIRFSSYITLIDKDYKKMEENQKKDRRKTLGFFISFLLNILSGVLASILYIMMTS